MSVGLPHLMFLSAVLLALGLYTMVTRRNAVAILMGVELVLNAGLLNLVAFSRFGRGIDGQVFGVFGVVLAAAEAVVALAIVLQVFRAMRSVDASRADRMKE
ncbi:MAG TPA: NADH-quinone oxidoreductase subunit NuoK [Myxococcota bacterium]|mgnify:CR=1 FL=1|nr:NADH-quinone oxidoreductase subunit NuoK [Myxococcota bacterium]HQK50902.1 NADH-quinone oxidoreductase subunit NuoK [Myxococcota bacterium]